MATESPVRCDVVFRGQVQGVGFRFTAVSVAKGLPVTGYVMNLRDGTVCMVAEGTRQSVSTLIRRVLDEMGGYVLDHTETWGRATGEFQGFQVERDY